MAKKDARPDILFISGSPRSRNCVALIDLLEQGAKKAGAKTQRFLLSKKRIAPCIGCGSCNTTGNCVMVGKTVDGHFVDDYLELKAVIERVDALAVVSPLYFAGPPSQLKALYDRLQPYWAQRYLLNYPVTEKRPAQLFVIGSGSDPHGYAPLAGVTKSALAVAGFNLEKVNNFIGFSSPKNVPSYPSQEEATSFTHAELARIKRRIAQQEGFVQRALDAGGAFARFVVKKKQANDLAEQLAKVEAELEVLKKVGDADKSEQVSHENALSKMDRGFDDRKGKLHAGIDLDYSNLISRTEREPDSEISDVGSDDEVEAELNAFDKSAADVIGDIEYDGDTDKAGETDEASDVDYAGEADDSSEDLSEGSGEEA